MLIQQLFRLMIVAVVIACGVSARAELKVAELFGDHMVLQRGMSVPVWGTATPGRKVTVRVGWEIQTAVADETGQWMVRLRPLSPGEPTTMTVADDDGSSITFGDVVVGDVWVCSGQSNMDWALRRASRGEEEVANASHPNLRLFKFARTTATKPSRQVHGTWQICTPETAADFSGVAYFFGRDVALAEDVPVGLIQSAWGGMPAEAFASIASLEKHEEFAPMVQRRNEILANYDENKARYDEARADWDARFLPDAVENTGVANGWAEVDHDSSEWRTMRLPQAWEQAGLEIDGVVWFRREVEIPESWEGKSLWLALSAIDDYDTTYFNGQQVGATGAEHPRPSIMQRLYEIDGKLVKPGRAVIAVRVYDIGGAGGLVGQPQRMWIAPKEASSPEPVFLAGDWLYRVERQMTIPARPAEPPGPHTPSLPAQLFNGMINPLIPYAITGAIWYQGESNVHRAEEYRRLFPLMIEDWRAHWRQGDFPFLFVQLANYLPRKSEPGDSAWAELREAQLMTLKLPNTGMAVAIDIGDERDIHPGNKQDVGRRLALAAGRIAYGRDIEWSGPIYQSMTIDGPQVRLKFRHGHGLQARGGDPLGFTIAGEDRVFHWAQARIEKDQVVVWSDAVADPVAVRYGWADNPDVNLYNGAGLPASPFRTDEWTRITEKARP